MSTIHFEIVTPEKTVLKEEVLQLTVPTKMGEITVLPHHFPLVASLQAGVIEIKLLDDKVETVAVSGGFIEVRKNNEVVVLADSAEKAEEIDIKRAEEARARARQLMNGKRRDEEAFADALSTKKIAGGGIDVFVQEPPVFLSNPLLKTPNSVMSPHVAFATKEALVRRAEIAFNNVIGFLNGKIQNKVC